MSAVARRAGRAVWTTQIFHGTDDTDEADVRAWLRVPAEARLEAAWQLSLEQWALGEPGPDHEQRLPRSALRVERR